LLALFVIYYWTWGQDIIERAKRIKAQEEGFDEKSEIPPDYKEPALFKIFDKKLSVIVCLALVPVVLFATFTMGTLTFYPPEEDDVDDAPEFNFDDYELTSIAVTPISGDSNEDTQLTIQEVVEEENIKSIMFVLTWTDEPDQDIRYENQPDEFTIEVVSPDEELYGPESAFNPQGGTGTISLSISFNPDTEPYLNGTGQYDITISCGSCGDQELIRPSIGLQDQQDNGNTWELAITYEYYKIKE
jgi:hypothetical protein